MKHAKSKLPVLVAIKLLNWKRTKSPEFSNPLSRDETASETRLDSAKVWIPAQLWRARAGGKKAMLVRDSPWGCYSCCALLDPLRVRELGSKAGGAGGRDGC